MRIFVGEYLCGGGSCEQPIDQIPQSLRNEGAAMLHAIVSDLSEVAQTVVPIDNRFLPTEQGNTLETPGATDEDPQAMVSPIPNDLSSVELVTITPDQPFWGQWVDAASGCDAALIVAPESDGILAKAVAMLRASGIDVIAGSGDFLRTASDKLLTAKALTRAAVAHPIYMSLSDRKHADKLRGFDRFVVKPRDGCGTQAIRVFESFEEAQAEMEENSLMQAWMPGRAISIAMVASPTEQTFLPAVAQNLQGQNCEYTGGMGPLDDDAQRRAMALAVRAIEAMPPTVRGFVGFDILLGDHPNEDYVIEINPRLTTSYVGLRQMIRGNLAARLFDMETGPVTRVVPAETVRWTAQGDVYVNDTVAG